MFPCYLRYQVRCRPWLVSAAFLYVCLSTVSLIAVAQENVEIRIESKWGGLGTPARELLDITGQSGSFKSNGQKVNTSKVAELLAAIEEPPISQPSLDECAVNRRWRESNYAVALQNLTHRRIGQMSAEEVELFKAHFVEAKYADLLFTELLKSWHTDDYPQISVTAKSASNEYGVRSESQNAFMLPWVGFDKPRGGYSCRISQAIAALLPKDFPNRTRLSSGIGFRQSLAESAMSSIRPEWNMLDTEFRLGPQIAPIKSKFTLVRSEISNLSSIDLDGTESWNAILRQSDLPPNLSIGVSLPYRHRKITGTEELIVKAPSYAQLVLSVSWLKQYLEEHRAASAELRYVNGRSLSPQATDSLTADLNTHSKTGLAHAVAEGSSSAAFLEINDGSGCWSRLVVLSSRDSLLWHFKCDTVLGFAADQFHTWDYYGWRSSGTLIAPDKTVKK
jgi:hypothetical protein